MANKGVTGRDEKKDSDGSKRWLKIALAVLFALIMLVVPLSIIMNPPPTGSGSQYAAERPFRSVEDGLAMIPAGAEYFRYVDLEADASIANWTLANLKGSLPNASLFGAQVKKDAIAVYPFPQFGFFRMPGNIQVVSLADFGPGFDNKSYPSTTRDGVAMRSINDNYAFTTDTSPAVHGMPQIVAPIGSFMMNGNARSSAYYDYADLFEQIASDPQTASGARFAVVGRAGSLEFGDRYYAGVTPLNDTCSYKIVVHLNRTLNETEKQTYKSRWEQSALYLYQFPYYSVKFTDEYLLVDARADAETCLNDLYYNWPGLLRG